MERIMVLLEIIGNNEEKTGIFTQNQFLTDLILFFWPNLSLKANNHLHK